MTITDSGKGIKHKKQLGPPTLTSGRGLGMQIIQELINDLNGSLKQSFVEEGCILTMEMEWPSEEE